MNQPAICTDVPRDHFLYRNMENVNKIAKVLEKDTDIRLSIYCRKYDDRTLISLTNTNLAEWTDYSFKKYSNQTIDENRLRTGINSWKQQKELSEAAEDARTNFDIDSRIDFVWRDDGQNCYHLYEFYSTRKNADKARHFYDLYRNKMLKFIVYFNEKAASLIDEGNKLENRILTPYYEIPNIPPKKRNYAAELVLENASLELTNREFEITLLSASGCTLKQIAKMLNNSPRTIEHYMSHIYGKTGCRDRKDLNKYIRTHGWQDLVEFFFDYIPQEN